MPNLEASCMHPGWPRGFSRTSNVERRTSNVQRLTNPLRPRSRLGWPHHPPQPAANRCDRNQHSHRGDHEGHETNEVVPCLARCGRDRIGRDVVEMIGTGSWTVMLSVLNSACARKKRRRPS